MSSDRIPPGYAKMLEQRQNQAKTYNDMEARRLAEKAQTQKKAPRCDQKLYVVPGIKALVKSVTIEEYLK